MTLRQLIEAECANYYSKMSKTNDYCCGEWTPDHRCIYFTQKGFPRCPYFERSVLPLDQGLEAIYRAERQGQAPLSKAEKEKVRLTVQSVCSVCGRPFMAKSNRQKYCGRCRKDAIRAREREKKERQRRAAVPL